ncbi:SH3 domain-containing protein [Bartonella raoultii]|uniref:SH3 domain-containing protein n=1 Tax=Bartonella raoultii TaxID=1457020 RepID=A0ABS7I6H0_9HYPH|nr:SH3 domain-containing protein [Bartonella raoultii]MBX4335183.1 SH3 domain-containing protein [Bartonella raoultii]
MVNKNFLSTTMILLTLGGAGLGVSSSYSIAGTAAYVRENHAVLRTGPATAYKVITTVPTGAKVQINGCLSNKNWCFLHYKGKAGWVFARFLNVNHIPTVSFTKTRMIPSSKMIVQKEKVKQPTSGFKALKVPQKTKKHVQKSYRKDLIIDSTGVKKRDERAIFNPSPKAQNISVKHVTAYNPFFPDDVNFKNFERNETRYRIITYPSSL